MRVITEGAAIETPVALVRWLKYRSVLHLHRVRFMGANRGKPYYRWALQTESSRVCKTLRCAKIQLTDRVRE